MNNLFTRILFTLAIMCLGYGAFAQQTQNVTVGSSLTYTAKLEVGTTDKEYKWKLLNQAGVDVLASEKSITASVDWLATGFTVGNTYRIESQVIDDNNCISEIIYVNVTVVGAGSVMFADAGGNDNVVTCSLLDGDLANTTDLTVNFTGGVAPYVLTYQVLDQAGATNTLTKTFNTNTDVLSATDWENNTATQQTYKITLISAVTKDGQDVTVDTGATTTLSGAVNNIRTLKVHGKPVIEEITLN